MGDEYSRTEFVPGRARECDIIRWSDIMVMRAYWDARVDFDARICALEKMVGDPGSPSGNKDFRRTLMLETVDILLEAMVRLDAAGADVKRSQQSAEESV